jgi:hypothetical protein
MRFVYIVRKYGRSGATYANMIVACDGIPAAALADGLPLRRLRRLGLHGA